MVTHNPSVDDRYCRYAELLLAQHKLLSQNAAEGDSEVIEDEMTQIWDALDSAQRQSLSGLSSDLGWLRRCGKPAPKTRPGQDVTEADLRELEQARERADWHRTLHQLRLCTAKLPPFELAFSRAAAWQALGLSEISGLFSRFAAKLEPNNTRLAFLPLPIEPGAGNRAATVD